MEITPQDTHTHTQPTLCIGYMERLGLDVKAQLKKREERMHGGYVCRERLQDR